MIIYAPDAEGDVTRLHDQLEERSVKAAADFMRHIAIAEKRIEARPIRYRQFRDQKARRYAFKINRITYLIDYRIDPSEIVVLRVWHGHQDRPL